MPRNRLTTSGDLTSSAHNVGFGVRSVMIPSSRWNSKPTFDPPRRQFVVRVGTATSVSYASATHILSTTEYEGIRSDTELFDSFIERLDRELLLVEWSFEPLLCTVRPVESVVNGRRRQGIRRRRPRFWSTSMYIYRPNHARCAAFRSDINAALTHPRHRVVHA